MSLDWPTENGWVNYNCLQQLAYFATVFLAAPLAIATGVRMSGIWPKNAKTPEPGLPGGVGAGHPLPGDALLRAFIFVHVVLVFATGALRNLNHMYASQDAVNWVGFWIFAASLVVIAAGWIAARPLVLAPIATPLRQSQRALTSREDNGAQRRRTAAGCASGRADAKPAAAYRGGYGSSDSRPLLRA